MAGYHQHSRFIEGEASTSPPPPSMILSTYSSSPPTKPKKRTKKVAPPPTNDMAGQYQHQYYTNDQYSNDEAMSSAPRTRVRPARTRTRTNSNLSDSGFSANSSSSSGSGGYYGYESPDTSEEADEAVTPPQVPTAGHDYLSSSPPRRIKKAPTVKTSFSDILEDTYVYDPTIYNEHNDEEYDYDENGHRVRHHRKHRQPGGLQRTRTERFRSLFHRAKASEGERLQREAKFNDY